jgi:hypothetical protein
MVSKGEKQIGPERTVTMMGDLLLARMKNQSKKKYG